MRTVRVTYDSMVDVMILYKPLDRHIDVYRHDKNLTIEVSFDEYLNFITYVLEEKKFLFSESSVLRQLVVAYVTTKSKVAHAELQINHVLDVMSAAAKELFLAEERGRQATQIAFAPSPDCEVIRADSAIQNFDPERHREFYRRLDLLGYKLPTSFNSIYNKKLADKISLSVKAALRAEFRPFIILG